MSTAPVFPQAGFGTSAGATHLRLTRRGRVVFTVAVSVPLVIGALFMAVNAGEAAASAPGPHTQFSYVTVHDGQSLWSIAERLAPSADPRDVIASIISLNQLSGGTVVPGERLAIPYEYAPAGR